MSDKKAKRGSLLMVSSGCYSDYSVHGFFVVLNEFSPKVLLDEFLNENPKQREDYGFCKDDYMGFLVQRGLLLEIEYGTIHLGDYGSSSEFDFWPFRDE